MTDIVPVEATPITTAYDLDRAFAEFMRLDVAAGDASDDTVAAYRAMGAAFYAWCMATEVDPVRATVNDVRRYRQAMIKDGYRQATIALRLSVLRQIFKAAVAAGARSDNPAVGVRAPAEKKALEDFKYLTEEELNALLALNPPVDSLGMRHRCLIGIMGLHGLRTIEVSRADVEDVQKRDQGVALLVRGKRRDRLVYLRADMADLLNTYLNSRKARGKPGATPIFTTKSGRRLSRRGVRSVVDKLLRQAGLKRVGLSCHALRHTAATLAYKYTKDLRAVQELLGHRNPATTARYAAVIDKAERNPVKSVPVSLE